MPAHTHHRLRTVAVPAQIAIAGLALAACSSGPGHGSAQAAPAWTDASAAAASRPVSGGGVTAVTGVTAAGAIQTVVTDLATGRRLWTKPATMAGRPAGMGVQPPAVLAVPGSALVVALEPGAKTAELVARDGKTGTAKWTRPVSSTWGPVRCGTYICLSDATAGKKAQFTALDPATGKAAWKTPGVGEVEWSDGARVVLFRMAAHPVVQARDLATGKVAWSYPVEQAVGAGINLSGGWAFGALGDTLVGYLAPYQAEQGKPLSAYGFFGLRISDGARLWTRPKLLRVYPSADPAIALITREVQPNGQYGGFAQLDPRTGQTTARLPLAKAPRSGWWLAFPSDLTRIGFLNRGHQGSAYDLRRAATVPVRGMTAWSFCTVTPAALPIKDQQGFYPIAALCAYDLASGKEIKNAGAPPGWYTGSTDGWRVWRDAAGALHGIHDATGTTPGMYG
jgi:outer membrane protein assembly factor BamB